MLKLTSSAFGEGELIPKHYTCDGANVNPQLSIEGIPEGTVSLALLVDDPDIPEFVKEKMGIDVFDHWTLFNIPVSKAYVEIGKDAVPDRAIVGKNSAGRNEYRGPCPPDREHRYFFKLFALDLMLELSKEATKADVMAAMEGHVLETAALLGRYARLADK